MGIMSRRRIPERCTDLGVDQRVLADGYSSRHSYGGVRCRSRAAYSSRRVPKWSTNLYAASVRGMPLWPCEKRGRSPSKRPFPGLISSLNDAAKRAPAVSTKDLRRTGTGATEIVEGRSLSEKVNIWMPIDVAAYLANTLHLSREEIGACLHLLFHSSKVGPLPRDTERVRQSPVGTKSHRGWWGRGSWFLGRNG